MSRAVFPFKSQPAKSAAWLEWAESTRSPRIDPALPAFRPFREAGIGILGLDHLKERFFAGTPCSPTHLVWVLIRGSISVDFGEGPVVLEKGRMAVCPALRPHWVRLVSKSAKGLWIHLLRVPRWQHLSNLGPGVLDSKHSAEMEWALEHCIRECGSVEFGSGQNALHYAEILSVLIERELSVTGPRLKAQPVLARLETIWAEIMEKPGDDWNVRRMAKSAGTSSRELHRLCAGLFGVGPMALVTRMRMDRSMELLLTTDRKIDDIAREVGYATAHAFSAAFLGHVGKRPGKFRDSGSPSHEGNSNVLKNPR